MLYIVHYSDQENVRKDILPFIEGQKHQLLSFPPNSDFALDQEDLLLTYLRDGNLKEFLPLAAKNQWPVGILPHPQNQLSIKGLGIQGNIEKTIEEILSREEEQELDLLFCNDRLVLQSVNIGNVFLLTQKEEKKKIFFSETMHFLRNIRKFSSLTHRPFQLSIDDDKIIRTSALGIIVVEHSDNSVVSKRLTPESSGNDGQFHVLILSPQNILDLFWFFVRSLMPRRKIRQLPSFIGQVRTSNLKIECPSEETFTVDGEKSTAETIDLRIGKQPLLLAQKSIYNAEKNQVKVDRSLKLERLPKGQKRNELVKYKLPLLPRATAEDFKELFTLLRQNSTVTSAFVVMMILSTLIAAFGLFGNSSPVIIGAMILAPIITPIVAFSMGMVRYDLSLLKNGIITILVGTVVALMFSALVSFIIPMKMITSEIEARLSPNLLDMGIAVSSGIAAAYAHAKAGIAKSLAGVAIAVALVPPLSVAGIGIGWWDWEVFSGAFLLYLTNLSGIILFAGFTFLLLGFAPFKTARLGLVYTFLLTMLVMVPLSLSFNQIIQEATITKQLEGSVFNEVILRDVQVRFGKEFLISVKLVAPQSIGTEEMETIKEQIEEQIGHPIILEVISAVEF